MEYFDKVKYTVINMLREKIDIPIYDSPIKTNFNTDKKFKFPKLLFKQYNKNKYNEIYVIDFDSYDKYGKEEIPNFDGVDIVGKFVVINKEKYEIIKYQYGLITLKNNVLNLSECEDVIILADEPNKEISEDFIIISIPYNYNKVLNLSLVENYCRIQIDIFINEDLNGDKIYKYTKIIHDTLDRDFNLREEDNIIIKNKIAYIYSPLSFGITEYNLTNKIVRGNMLVKTYNR